MITIPSVSGNSNVSMHSNRRSWTHLQIAGDGSGLGESVPVYHLLVVKPRQSLLDSLERHGPSALGGGGAGSCLSSRTDRALAGEALRRSFYGPEDRVVRRVDDFRLSENSLDISQRCVKTRGLPRRFVGWTEISSASRALGVPHRSDIGGSEGY